MSTFLVEQHESVAIIKLDRQVTNAINLQLVDELAITLRDFQREPEVRALVLCSTNDKFFSIGFDIPKLYELSRKDFSAFYRLFNRTCLQLYTFPKPTVAAITGHAIAGGCILALCCDYRFIAAGHKLIGLNEIKLGVPVPYPADRILRNLVGERTTRDVIDMGEFYPAQQALEVGLVDRLLPLEQVLPAALEKAIAMAVFPPQAFALIKRNRVEPVESQIRRSLSKKEHLFIERWYSKEARARLKNAMQKF